VARDDTKTGLFDHGGGVWTAQTEVRFPGGVWLPLRMTVVRLGSGELWVHSPITIDSDLADKVAALGSVRYLVGPNRVHHLHLGTWAKRFPDAEIWGAEGLAAKRPDLRFAGTVTGTADPWHGDIESVPIEGSPKLGETVFFHRASRTLIVTDLLFNIHNARGLLTRMVLRLTGTNGRFAQSRIWRFGVSDRVALAESGRRVVALAPARVVVAHGDVIDPLPPGALAQALARMIAASGSVPKAA
jgi:Domain of unknown function (DUF4336)